MYAVEGGKIFLIRVKDEKGGD
jgi:hypothetical protein